MHHHRLASSLTLLASLLCISTVAAQPREPRGLELPPELAPWAGWVLHGQESALCPQVRGEALCAWPTLLELDLDAAGGHFRQDVYLEHDQYQALPGSTDRWPQQVEVDGAAAVVMEGPRVWLKAGRHRIQGRFLWDALPEALQTPATTGQVQLRVAGQEVARPRRNAAGRLWLAGSATNSADAQRLDVQVFRHIADGSPLQVTTRLELSVGGKPREVVLRGAVLDGTFAIDLSSSLPARLEPDGSLRVQVSAGDHRVEILAVSPAPQQAFKAPSPKGTWPDSEIWVWVASPALRQVELGGAPPVDPARTALADDWRKLPTFMLKPGEALTLETRRRGEPEPPPNQVSMERDLWLDLDGAGYTARDTLRGAMQQRWRLDLAGGQLGRASVSGDDRLITLYEGVAGVELRDSELALVAEWRTPREGSALPAVGWSQDVDSLSTRLHLPPGWSLLGGEGADRMTGTLLSNWDLWSFFFVLLVALATFKLVGPVWGALALLALSLCTHEPGAPETVWLWLLAGLALSRLTLRGVWAGGARSLLWGSVLAALVVALPFCVAQVRQALYPQVSDRGQHLPLYSKAIMEMERADLDAADEGMLEDAVEEAPAAPMPESSRTGGSAKRMAAPSIPLGEMAYGSTGSSKQRARAAQQDLDPGTVVQTGPGVPDWTWHTSMLHWNGPVQHDQTLTLWLIPPWLNRLLCLLRVLLVGGLLFGLLRGAGRTRGTGGAGGAGGARSIGSLAAAVALWVAAGLLSTSHAQAQPNMTAPGTLAAPDAPPDELLDELRRRLLRAPDCAPDCVTTSSLSLKVAGDLLTVRAEVHAGSVVAYRAPGPLSSWAPAEVRVDGGTATAATRLEDDSLHVRLAPGRHIVELSGAFPASDALTLQLGTPPHRVSVDAPGFQVDGVRPDGTADQSIQLRREVKREAGDAQSPDLPPWLEVTRTFDFGVRFNVRTHLRRLGHTGAALLARVPLLDGESVTQAGVQADKGVALVRFGPGERETQFLSALDPRDTLHLQAPNTDSQQAQPFSMVWEYTCSPLYRCEASGMAPVSHRTAGHWMPRYRPWPGETLDLSLARLEPAAGSSTTVDQADLRWTPGGRLTRGELSLTVRTSSGSTLRMQLPEGAQLKSVAVDDGPRSAELQKGALALSLQPGTRRVSVHWQQAKGLTSHFQAPAVKVGEALVNMHVRIRVPEDRWLLWASGPAWGPAVLFWGYLVSVMLFALALSFVPGSPLRRHQWLLLSLGLTQIPAIGALTIVGWFFAMQQRKQRPARAAWLFDVVQVALLGLTFLAVGCLINAVHEGLVVQPDMQVTGAGSDVGELVWYLDRGPGDLPTPSLFSVPLWIYKGLMLCWSLWLAANALSWLRMGWEAFSEGGRWRVVRSRLPLQHRAAAAAETGSVEANESESEPSQAGDPDSP